MGDSENFNQSNRGDTRPVKPVENDFQWFLKQVLESPKTIEKHENEIQNKKESRDAFAELLNKIAGNRDTLQNMTPEITPTPNIANSAPRTAAPRPSGVELPNAPFATQAEADADYNKQLLQNNINTINKKYAATRPDEQFTTTNTLGTGIVKQETVQPKSAANALALLKSEDDLMNKKPDALSIFKAKEDYKLSLKSSSLDPQKVLDYGQTILDNSSALPQIPPQYKGEAIRYARSKDPNWKYTSAWQMSPVGTETAKLVGNDETIHGDLYGTKNTEGIYDISDRLSMNQIWTATFGNSSGSILKNATSLLKNSDQLNLNSNLAQMHNVLLNMLSGAAVSSQEAARIANQILPLVGDDKNTWTTRIQMTLDQVNNIARQAMMTRGEFVEQSKSGDKKPVTKKIETKGGIKVGSAMQNLLKGK